MAEQELSRRERKKDETRQRIVEQAMQMFESRGYDAVTMEQIAEAADVAKGTLYNYFPVKEAIVSAYMRTCALQAAPEIAKMMAEAVDTRERLTTLFVRIAQWQQGRRELYRYYLNYRMTQLLESLRNPELRSGFEQNLILVIQQGIDDGELRGDLPAVTLAGYLESAYLMVIMSWLALDDYDYESGLLQMVDIFLTGARQPETGRCGA